MKISPSYWTVSNIIIISVTVIMTSIWPVVGADAVMGIFATQIKECKFKRLHCAISGDYVACDSHFSGTATGETPEGMPHFLGLTPEQLKDKEFQSIAIDDIVHKVVDGKIKQSYHYEDMFDAREQILSGRGKTVVSYEAGDPGA